MLGKLRIRASMCTDYADDVLKWNTQLEASMLQKLGRSCARIDSCNDRLTL